MLHVQGKICLAQVEEDFMEGRLYHGNELMNQLSLKGGGPRSSPRTKSMQNIIELDGRQYLAIDNSGYCLPQDLRQASPPEVSTYPLGDHNHRLSGAWRREFSSPEGRLYDCNNLLLSLQVGVLLPLRRPMLHPEVLCLHY